MTWVQYVTGLALTTLCLAPIVAAAIALRVRALPSWTGAPARVAEAVAGLALLLLALELAGVAGAFDRVGVTIVCVAVGACGLVGAKVVTARPGEPPPFRTRPA